LSSKISGSVSTISIRLGSAVIKEFVISSPPRLLIQLRF
jgi:hypothetical protein